VSHFLSPLEIACPNKSGGNKKGCVSSCSVSAYYYNFLISNPASNNLSLPAGRQVKRVNERNAKLLLLFWHIKTIALKNFAEWSV
jgi:hypothetical protein